MDSYWPIGIARKVSLILLATAALAPCSALAQQAGAPDSEGEEWSGQSVREVRQPVQEGKWQGRYEQSMQQARQAFQAAREECESMTGDRRKVCMETAQAQFASAKSGAKARREAAQAGLNAYQTEREATYDLQRQKCKTLKEESRRVCLEGLRDLFDKQGQPGATSEQSGGQR